jgi:hypothetical protein
VTGAASIAAVALAVVFAWAALAQMAARRRVSVAFAALRLPAPGTLAVAVPVAELGISVALIARPDVGGALALAALAAFTLVIVRALSATPDAPCGCFGSHRVEPVAPSDVVRNGILAGFAAVATGTSHLVWPGAASMAAMVVAVGAGGLVQLMARRIIGPARP